MKLPTCSKLFLILAISALALSQTPRRLKKDRDIIRTLKSLAGIDPAFSKDLASFDKIFVRHTHSKHRSRRNKKALAQLGTSVVAEKQDEDISDEDVDALVKESMAGAEDILKSLMHKHRHRRKKVVVHNGTHKHSLIGSEHERVQTRRVKPRIKVASQKKRDIQRKEDEETNSNQASIRVRKTKKTDSKVESTHSLINSEHEHSNPSLETPLLDLFPVSSGSGSKHMMFPHQQNMSPVNKTEEIQKDHLMSTSEIEGPDSLKNPTE